VTRRTLDDERHYDIDALGSTLLYCDKRMMLADRHSRHEFAVTPSELQRHDLAETPGGKFRSSPARETISTTPCSRLGGPLRAPPY